MKRRPPPRAQPAEQYLRVFYEIRPLLRRLIFGRQPARPEFFQQLLLLIAAVDHLNYVQGTIQELADIAGCRRNAMSRALGRMGALNIAFYDHRRRVLEFDPRLVFAGSERERRRVIKEWIQRPRRHLAVVS